MENNICPKEVAAILGVQPRTAQALMKAGEIESMRVGPKLLRTTALHVEAYRQRQFRAFRGGCPGITEASAIRPGAL